MFFAFEIFTKFFFWRASTTKLKRRGYPSFIPGVRQDDRNPWQQRLPVYHSVINSSIPLISPMPTGFLIGFHRSTTLLTLDSLLPPVDHPANSVVADAHHHLPPPSLPTIPAWLEEAQASAPHCNRLPPLKNFRKPQLKERGNKQKHRQGRRGQWRLIKKRTLTSHISLFDLMILPYFHSKSHTKTEIMHRKKITQLIKKRRSYFYYVNNPN